MENSSPQIWSCIEALTENNRTTHLCHRLYLVPFRYVMRYPGGLILLRTRQRLFILRHNQNIRCKMIELPGTEEMVKLPIISVWDALSKMYSLYLKIPKIKKMKFLFRPTTAFSVDPHLAAHRHIQTLSGNGERDVEVESPKDHPQSYFSSVGDYWAGRNHAAENGPVEVVYSGCLSSRPTSGGLYIHE